MNNLHHIFILFYVLAFTDANASTYFLFFKITIYVYLYNICSFTYIFRYSARNESYYIPVYDSPILQHILTQTHTIHTHIQKEKAEVNISGKEISIIF